jgi:hypothetical protein
MTKRATGRADDQVAHAQGGRQHFAESADVEHAGIAIESLQRSDRLALVAVLAVVVVFDDPRPGAPRPVEQVQPACGAHRDAEGELVRGRDVDRAGARRAPDGGRDVDPLLVDRYRHAGRAVHPEGVARAPGSRGPRATPGCRDRPPLAPPGRAPAGSRHHRLIWLASQRTARRRAGESARASRNGGTHRAAVPQRVAVGPARVPRHQRRPQPKLSTAAAPVERRAADGGQGAARRRRPGPRDRRRPGRRMSSGVSASAAAGGRRRCRPRPGSRVALGSSCSTFTAPAIGRRPALQRAPRWRAAALPAQRPPRMASR